VLVDTVEHLNVSEMICTGLLIWQCPQHQCSKATIGNHNHRSPRQPSPHLPYHLSGPIRQLLVSMISLFVVAVKGLRRLETVMPRPAARESAEHQTQPPQTTGFNQVAITGANWVTIDPLAAIRSLGDAQSYHLAPLPALLLVQTLLSNDVTRFDWLCG